MVPKLNDKVTVAVNAAIDAGRIEDVADLAEFIVYEAGQDLYDVVADALRAGAHAEFCGDDVFEVGRDGETYYFVGREEILVEKLLTFISAEE